MFSFSSHNNASLKRGLGFFGDDNDKVRELERQRESERIMRVPTQTGTTDANGSITFENLPVGLYVISVALSQDFCAA